jgi:hypothetical protein
MRGFSKGLPQPKSPDVCTRCNGIADGVVWGYQLCQPCIGQWTARREFEFGHVAKTIGSEDHAPICAEYRRLTTAWLREGDSKHGARL